MVLRKAALVNTWREVLDGVFPFTRTTSVPEAVLRAGKLTYSVIGHLAFVEKIKAASPEENW
jgi:hypothetical protein